MKKLFFLAVLLNLLLLNSETYAQIQFASVKLNGQGLNNIPRISWNLPLSLKKTRLSKNLHLMSGITLRNEGVIFDYQGDRFKKRAISIGPSFNFVGKVGGSLIYTIGFGLDYNFH